MEHIEFNEWQLVIVKNYVNMVCVCVLLPAWLLMSSCTLYIVAGTEQLNRAVWQKIVTLRARYDLDCRQPINLPNSDFSTPPDGGVTPNLVFWQLPPWERKKEEPHREVEGDSICTKLPHVRLV